GGEGRLAVSQADAIWITGVGAATPLGNDYRSIADNLLAGCCGVRSVTNFDVSQHPSQIAALIPRTPCPPESKPAELAVLNPLEQLVIWWWSAALRDADCWGRREEIRVGVVLGLGAEWPLIWEADALRGGRLIAEAEQRSEGHIQFVRRKLG